MAIIRTAPQDLYLLNKILMGKNKKDFYVQKPFRQHFFEQREVDRLVDGFDVFTAENFIRIHVPMAIIFGIVCG